MELAVDLSKGIELEMALIPAGDRRSEDGTQG